MTTPVNIVILPKKQDDTVVISSDILSKSLGIQSSSSSNSGVNGGQSKKSENGEELKVFKHKEVNTLIRSRIKALENSVVTKTVERPPLKEVDKTITEVKKEVSEETVEQIKEPPKKPEIQQTLPTSTIRELAMEMQKERPSNDVEIKPLPVQPRSKPSPQSVPPVQEQKLPAKPALKKQYSFTMDKKFHEESGQDGWQTVQDIASSSSSEETDEEESSDQYRDDSSMISQSILNVESSSEESEAVESLPPPPPPPPAIKKKEKEKVKPKSSIKKTQEPQVDTTNSEDEIPMLAPETVRKILNYGDGEYYEGRESVVNYYRREQEDFSGGERRYSDSDTSQLSEYERRKHSQKRYGPRTSAYNQYETDLGYNTPPYHPDDRSFVESDGGESYRQGYYYSDDDRTLVDEEEFRRREYEEYDPRDFAGYPHDPRDVYEDYDYSHGEYEAREDFDRHREPYERAYDKENDSYRGYESGYRSDHPYANSPEFDDYLRLEDVAPKPPAEFFTEAAHEHEQPEGYYDRELYLPPPGARVSGELQGNHY